MKVIEQRDATATLAAYAADTESGPVIVTIEGRPVAALVALDNTDPETPSLSTNPEFVDLIERSLASAGSKGGIPSDEMRRRLGSASKR
jgi:hypothetical protein